MPAIPGFEHDIFISYARVDNIAATPSEKGWVDLFHRELEIQIARRVGRIGECRFWRDTKIDGSEVFDEVIQNRLRQCAILIALCSPGYLKSTYCQKELDTFTEEARQAHGGTQVGHRSRVLNVLLYRIPHDQWPAALQGTIGFALHEPRDTDPLGEPLKPGTEAFDAQIGRLRNAILEILTEMKAPPDPSAPKIAHEDTIKIEPAEEPPTDVFLAAVSDSLRPLRSRVSADLQARGISTITDIPPPWDPIEHEQAVHSALQRAKISVHLMDGFAGTPIESHDITFPQAQVSMARHAGCHQIVWMPKNLELSRLEDPLQTEFLTNIEDGHRAAGSYQVIRSHAGVLVHSIRRELDRIQNERPLNPSSAVLLDTHIKDQALALEMSRCLLDRNIQPFINPEADDPRRNTRILEHRLEQVQALIILYCEASEEWVRARLAQAINIVVAKRVRLRACGIFLGPPKANKNLTGFDMPLVKVHMMDNRRGLNPHTLQPFLSDLGQKGSG